MEHLLSNKDTLSEMYDDLLFRMAISEYAEIEGSIFLYENEQLKSNPEWQLSDKTKRAIKKELARIELKNKTIRVIKTLRPAATVACVAFTILGSLAIFSLSVSANARKMLYNLLTEMDSAYTEFTPSTDYEQFIDAELYVWDHIFAPTYLPDGFYLFDHFDTDIFGVIYMNEEGQMLSFTQSMQSQNRVDTENADRAESILIGDSLGYISSKSGRTVVVWNVGDMMLTVSSDLNEDEVVQVAQSIKVLR